MTDWLSTILIVLPMLGALVVWLVPLPRHQVGSLAALISLVEVGIWIVSLQRFDFASPGLQLSQQHSWFSSLGVSYYVGQFGFSLWLVGLTVVCGAAACMYAWWAGRDRPRAYFGLLLFLTGSVVGVFCAQDLLLFYAFFEAMLIPLYVMIGVWGGPGRLGATLKFVVYTVAGSLLMLAAIVVYGVQEGTFNLLEMHTSTNDWLFLGFAIAFAVKAPLFPFHGWLPDAYRESPPEVAGLLSGVISKVAAYGFLRIAIAKFPEPADNWQTVILVLASIGLVYGSLLAFRAPDMRGVIAYSSLAQIALITYGLFAFNSLGIDGAVLQMVNHGLLSMTLFLLAGMVERRTSTGELASLGGMARGRPALATLLMIAGVMALAVPLSSNFAGEFLVLAGVFQTGWGWAVVGVVAIVLAAMYMLRLISAVLHQEVGPAVSDAALDLRSAELAIVVPLVVILLALSAWPNAISGHSFSGARTELTGLVQSVAGGRALMNKPHVDWFALSPTLSLIAAAALLLMVAVFVPKRSLREASAIVGGLGFAVAMAFAIALSDRSPVGATAVADSIFRDRWAALAQVLIAGCGIVAVLISHGERWSREHVAEYYALLAAAGAGMMFFVQASNLMTMFLGLEWFSIALYVLCAIDIDLAGSLEAGLKYLIIGSVGAATLLFGSALVYGSTGSLSFDGIAAAGDSHQSMLVLGLALIIAGLAFKSSAAPFHMWTPDVYQGAPTPVTSFMSSATKIAALVVTYRLMVTAFPANEGLWTWAFAIIACISLAVGNIAALAQRNVKRLLAYSSVSHAGFMLIAITANSDKGAQSLMYYLIPYAAMSLGAFAVVAARERELGVPVTLENLAGFGWERPFLGVSMWVFMLGFLGFPLTGGFWGKIYVFAAAYDSGWWWLIVVGVLFTMVSAAYYLAVVRAMFFRDSAELQLAPAGGSPPRDNALAVGVGTCLAVTVGSFFVVQPLIDACASAARSLPF